MLSVMSGDGTVSSLRFDGAILGDQNGGHQTEGTIALSDAIRLNITIVVLASPDEATIRLEHISNHIIDKSVLIPETLSLVLLLVVRLVDGGKGVLESAVILLQDGVLGGHVQGVVSVKGILEASMSEFLDGIVMVVHTNTNTTARVVEDLEGLLVRAVLRGEDHLEFTGSVNDEIGGLVLITESVSANNDGLLPAGDVSRDLVDDDGLSEDGAAEVISDGTVGGLPHLLKVEFLDSGLIGGDGGALNTNLAFSNGLSCIHGDLIVGLVSVFHAQIEILDVQVQEGEDKLVLDHLPDDSGHLITIELSNGILNLDFLEFHYVYVCEKIFGFARKKKIFFVFFFLFILVSFL
mmetsp:Transcript_58958/g.81813  ORF Transcript_58958/g.81813 Transcript_58958/m.81813 type:complete len:351 (-) Transcript_58958:3-1055(-)